MLFFGHIGITTGVVKICQELTLGRESNRNEILLKSQSGKVQCRQHNPRDNIRDKIAAIDYRFVFLGSLLPDIIDKPMWLFTANNLGWAGRGYAHTFLFSLLLLIGGLILASRWNKTWLITVAVGCFFHLIFDQMWLNPTALWWPLLGPIPREAPAGWLFSLAEGLMSNPYVYISETVGFIITCYIGLRLMISGRVRYFLKTGDIDWRKSPPTSGTTETKAG
jgi:membrane-bound metal-dependent hydrolase YbcI (DUF457 family)